MWDTAYWGFLRVRTTFDILQNIHLLYLEYGVYVSPGYGVLVFMSSWFLVKYDVLLLGEWSRDNVQWIVHLLKCFQKVSGLQINLHKSSLYGVRIPCTHTNSLVFIKRIQKNYILSDKWNNGWVWNWTRSISRGIILGQFNKLLHLLEVVNLLNRPDAWHWDLANSKIFTVKETRLHIDDALLPNHLPETRWCRFIPKKVSIISWIVLRDRLSNRWNLSRKGFDIPSLLCPVCSSFPETNFHIFWSCNVSLAIWKFIFNWVDIHPPSILDLFNWLDDSEETYEPQGITVLDFDDESEEQNEEFTLQSTNTVEWSAFDSYKDKEDVDNHNNSFKDLISPIKEHGKESVPFKVGEGVIEANTTPYLPTLKNQYFH
ncbi:reverse transcriptase domain, reverse transcriptase zinc-binding domain protein [Tanacetum coccineum]|uniref:Reverse transcriptase domain, reverse transcriptase zinc-binding domain protein n=1 Tax=Tanacetum coccineum TaxID=301880 RepID=A0ABQ5GTB0_9ASTR